jgi:hypothetical protein
VTLIFLITAVRVPQETNAYKNFTLESFSLIVFHTMSLITISFSVRT